MNSGVGEFAQTTAFMDPDIRQDELRYALGVT